ncbi:hypothetical protein LWI29_031221 [Acer saccharum]|uniref:Reverse transcriptase/retrotransposon-derived protein RNase H-like domain-containing protein n=1 Tax=Acer saccharum TaxID=4024 RepID=A0AA39VGV9_ACESA|nr:hypothetical protein LWI29_031221 [Acer saccharum]
MLSEKKSIVGRSEIEFLGMHISNGQYQPGPHLVVRLLDFPDSDLSVYQVQQFLGIVNYVRDFLPHVSHYTSVLSTLLKKRPPPWSSYHTKAIIKLKEISQSPPALTIPSSGQLVLQTDASDIFWGAVLIEDREGHRSYCGHASGKFKDSQQHYHTIYKKILAAKYGIQKLDFHLRIRNFIVEMDNSSFPKVLDFCNKIPPNPLLLRLKDWFARYDFTVRHVKSHHNIIADILSRPPLTHLITPTGHYPLIYMTSPAGPSSSHAGPSSSSPAIQDYSFPPELLATLPPDHQPSLDQIQSFAKAQLPVYLARINSQDCRHTVNNLSRPFLDPFIMPPFYYFSPQLLWFLWCLSVLHHHAIVFPLQALYGHLHDPSQQNFLLRVFLQWFTSLTNWKNELTKLMGQYNLWKLDYESAASVCCIWIFHRPYRYNPHKRLLWTANTSYEWHTTYNYPKMYPRILQVGLLNFLCDVNYVSTDEVFILPDVPRDPTQSWNPFLNSYMIDSQEPFDSAWLCFICGAQDSDDKDHANCNLSSSS